MASCGSSEPLTNTRMYVCECGKSFRTSSKYNRHYRIHSGDSSFICPYPQCGRSYTRREHLRRHSFSHSGQRPYACTVHGCKAAFAASYQLKCHSKTHSTPSPFQCLECESSFNKRYLLRQHMFIHTGIPEFSCDYIASSSSNTMSAATIASETSSSVVTPHTHTHNTHSSSSSSSATILSQPCTATFATKAELGKHRRKHLRREANAKRRRINAYSSSSSAVSSLHNATSDVTMVLPCPHCNRSFTRSNLNVHVRVVHQHHRPFECIQCSRRFGYKQSLQRHQATHATKTMKKTVAKKSKRISFRTMLCGAAASTHTQLYERVGEPTSSILVSSSPS